MLTARMNVDNTQFELEVPDKCPICHRLAQIRPVQSHKLPDDNGVEILYMCSVADCRRYFIATYEKPERFISKVTPQHSDPTTFPTFLREVSPSFLSIYEESEQALTHGLNQIAGPGFRKAFEFLVKDYAVLKQPDRAEEIKKSFSALVIGTYIVDPRIQAAAKRALWLGNDETHYLRKWKEHDIVDLKVLIKLTTNWMEIEHLSAKYSAELPDGT